MRIVDSIVAELDQEAATTRRVLERVPADKLAWQPHPRSMSLGRLALHVAQTPGAIAGLVSAPTMALTGPIVQKEATSTAEIMEALDESLSKARHVLHSLDDVTALSTWTLTAGGKTLIRCLGLESSARSC